MRQNTLLIRSERQFESILSLSNRHIIDRVIRGEQRMSPECIDILFMWCCCSPVALNGARKCSRTNKNISKRSYPNPELNAVQKPKTHLSPSQSPVLVDGAINTPRDTAEPPKVRDDRECDDAEEDILGAFREESSGEDEVVEHVRGHQDGKVERRELGCR
jgi:hypothetical protein